MYTCRECERPINQASEICPYCGADLTQAAEPEEPSPPRSLGSILTRWGVIVLTLSFALWAFVHYVLPRDPAARAETEAAGALREVGAALAAYAGAQGGSYPPQLEALGERARGAVQKALSGGYRLEYTPGPAGSDGAVRTFTLLARPGNYGYRNFYTDQSGVVRSTREKRPATAQDEAY